MSVATAVADTINAIAHPYQVDSGPGVLGPSKIKTYLQCPMQFKLRYVDRVPVQPRAEAALGTAIHAVISHAHTWRWNGRNRNDAAEMLEAIWDGIEPVGKDDPDVEVSYRQARDVWIPEYLAWASVQDTIAVEQRWECDLDADGEPIPLQGTIDRVYRDGGPYIVSDVKSEKRTRSASKLSTDLQLSLYAWAFQQLAGSGGEEVCEIVHLRGFEKNSREWSYRTRRSPQYLDYVMDLVVIPVVRLIQQEHFPAHPGGLYGCDYCECQYACPVGQGGEEYTDGSY